ncbi:Uncharacterised protein [Mycobacteroides abscessus subsp. abscessus]|nr:Uncharacterised protein [Mycobacteroides abscessus subsp. abscessus]
MALAGIIVGAIGVIIGVLYWILVGVNAINLDLSDTSTY